MAGCCRDWLVWAGLPREPMLPARHPVWYDARLPGQLLGLYGIGYARRYAGLVCVSRAIYRIIDLCCRMTLEFGCRSLVTLVMAKLWLSECAAAVV